MINPKPSAPSRDFTMKPGPRPSIYTGFRAPPTAAEKQQHSSSVDLRPPSLILLRSIDHLTLGGGVDLLLANLTAVTEYRFAAAVVSLSREHLRVWPLPLR
jgi:hypothetical protein